MIYLLCSTIRPETFIQTHQVWMNKCVFPEKIRTKVVVDRYDDLSTLKNYDVMLYCGNSIGITKPLTKLTQSLQGCGLSDDDIIVVMSDDFFPPDRWDDILYKQFSGFNGALNVFDGGPPEVQKSIITIPIMTYWCLKRLNHIIYHPAYTHMFSDNELFDILTQIKMMKTLDKSPENTFEHRHWSRGTRKMDDVDRQLNDQSYRIDEETYKKRKLLSVEKKLKYKLNEKVLSILICTTPPRQDFLSRLMRVLAPQITDRVEILIDQDENITIGEKRQRLLEKSVGKYVCFVDDDDLVSESYVYKILTACQRDVDCIGIRGEITTDGKNPKPFIHSIRNNKWEETKEAYLRTPNHLNPIRRTLAIETGYDITKNFQEDLDFSNRIRDKLKVECYISDTIYYYLFRSQK